MDTRYGQHLLVTVKPDGGGRITIQYDNVSIPIPLTDKERRELITMLIHPDDMEREAVETEEAVSLYSEHQREKQQKESNQSHEFKLLHLRKDTT
jgi:hypothetical protein